MGGPRREGCWMVSARLHVEVNVTLGFQSLNKPGWSVHWESQMMIDAIIVMWENGGIRFRREE